MVGWTNSGRPIQSLSNLCPIFVQLLSHLKVYPQFVQIIPWSNDCPIKVQSLCHSVSWTKPGQSFRSVADQSKIDFRLQSDQSKTTVQLKLVPLLRSVGDQSKIAFRLQSDQSITILRLKSVPLLRIVGDQS